MHRYMAGSRLITRTYQLPGISVIPNKHLKHTDQMPLYYDSLQYGDRPQILSIVLFGFEDGRGPRVVQSHPVMLHDQLSVVTHEPMCH